MPMPSYRFKTQAAQTSFKFVAAAILQIVQEYENGRNSGAATGIIVQGQAVVQKGTMYNGTVIEESHTAADLDKPTPAHVTENDTTGLVDGLIPLSDVMPASGGTSDKLYSAAQEQTRNTPDAAKYEDGEHFNKWGEDTEGSYVSGGVDAPTAPFLDLAVISDTKITASWTPGILGEYFKLKRKATVGGSYSYVGGDSVTHEFSNEYSYEDSGLTPATNYTYAVEIYNDTDDATSIEKNMTTLSTAAVPTSNPEGDLLLAIRAAILEIVDSGGAAVFAAKNVVVGEFVDSDTDEDGADMKSLINRDAADFPCVEIAPQRQGGGGRGYESQRSIQGIYGVRIGLHVYKAIPARVTGADIKTLSLYMSAIIHQMFRMTDKSQGNTPPCPGFLQTMPEFSAEPMYELMSQNINTGIIEMSFRADNEDVEI